MKRFDTYVDRCLYGPEGFYTQGGSAGRRGDFLTSPEVGPLFGVVLSRLIDSWWEELGRPTTMTVYDVGTGPGTLVTSLNAAPKRGSWTASGIDRVGASAVEKLPEDLTGSVIIANELLDNMAFRQVERQPSGWFEVYVDTTTNPAQPVGKLTVCDPPNIDIPVNTRAPVLEQARLWVADMLERGADRVLIFDYGLPTTTELATRGGWLRTYRDHQRGHDPYEQPGSCDITCDIGFDQLPGGGELTTQAELLKTWGIDELIEQGKQYWAAHTARPNVEAFRMRSRVSEGAALCDPNGLGSWLAASWRSSR